MRLAINGALGRMGRMVLDAALASGSVRDVILIDPEGNRVTRTPFGERMVFATPADLPPEPIDAGIDFSSPKGAVAFVTVLANRSIPVISGTTGVSEADVAVMREAAAKAAILWTPNTSLGVYCLHELASLAATMLGPTYDCEIVETHHRHKKDAPSGTAISLARHLGASLPDLVVGRHGAGGERASGVIGVSSVRGGEVAGDHTVFFLGEHDRIEITHRATSRMVFARGALELARRIRGRQPGWYTIEALLSQPAKA